MVDAIEWACVLCGCLIQNDWMSRVMNLHQILCSHFTKTIWMIQKTTAMGNWWLAASSQQCSGSYITFVQSFSVKLQISQVTQLRPPQPRHGALWLLACPKTNSPMKGKRFQTTDEIQEKMMGQLMVPGRTVWGPKVPTLKGTQVSLSYVQCSCILYLLQ